MRKSLKTGMLARFLIELTGDQEGQATVEFVLTLSAAIAIVSVIAIGFRRSILAVWQAISKEVTAACPGCPADPAIRFR
jgi:hypothetical protein